MIMTTHHVTAIDGKPIFARSWRADNEKQQPPRGVVHILHGVAEHSGRYHLTAEKFCDAGFIVVAHDHRGHGQTASTPEQLGQFAERYGWQLVISDTHAVNKDIRERFPGLPIIGLGHSMGCFALQTYGANHPDHIDAIALSAPTFTPPLMARAATILATAEKIGFGRKTDSRLLQHLIFSGYNRRFKPNRTPFDWLSRNPQVVDTYLADEKCGFTGSTQLWQDLTEGVSVLYAENRVSLLPKSIPYYLFAGGDDPMSKSASGVRRLINRLKRSGIKDITVHIYPEGRHEMLNEVNHTEVANDLVRWCRKVTKNHQDQESQPKSTVAA
jgi:alpha-beta hydrolase superfamily lysophospholipase